MGFNIIRNIKVRKKLILSYLMVVLLIIAVGLIGIISLKTVN